MYFADLRSTDRHRPKIEDDQAWLEVDAPLGLLLLDDLGDLGDLGQVGAAARALKICCRCEPVCKYARC